MTDQPVKFEQYAIVEVYGHSSYAGLVTEFQIGGAAFVRVEVPNVDGRSGFTKLLGPGSIFAITPCSREATEEWTKRNRTKPLAAVDLVQARVPALPGFRSPEDVEDFENEHDY